jgi:hypothetical protein
MIGFRQGDFVTHRMWDCEVFVVQRDSGRYRYTPVLTTEGVDISFPTRDLLSAFVGPLTEQEDFFAPGVVRTLR